MDRRSARRCYICWLPLPRRADFDLNERAQRGRDGPGFEQKCRRGFLLQSHSGVPMRALAVGRGGERRSMCRAFFRVAIFRRGWGAGSGYAAAPWASDGPGGGGISDGDSEQRFRVQTIDARLIDTNAPKERRP